MTTETEIKADELASKRNQVALGVMTGIYDLLSSYDPEGVLEEGVVGDLVWEVEELLIDASYEIEDLVEGFAEGILENTLAQEPFVPGEAPLVDGGGWELPIDEEDVKADTPVDSDESVEDPGFAVGV